MGGTARRTRRPRARIDLVALVAPVVLMLAPGCRSGTSFDCESDQQCEARAPSGRCEDNGYCSFEDDECASGRRYGTLTGSSVGGVCLPEDPETTSSDATSVASSAEGSSGGSGPTTETSTSGLSAGTQTDTGIDPSTSTSGSTSGSMSTSTGPSGSDTGTTSGGSSSTGPGTVEPLFFDDFDRPDAEDLGGSWVEGNPDAFAIVSDRAAPQQVATSYPTNLAEVDTLSVLDLTMSVEIIFEDADVFSFPQMHARIGQSNGSLRSYLCYARDTDEVIVSRQDEGGQIYLASASFADPLDTQSTYRLVGDVTGTNPVSLSCRLERITGGDDEVVAEVAYDDTDANRITTPGRVGLSVHDAAPNFVYDDFEVNEP